MHHSVDIRKNKFSLTYFKDLDLPNVLDFLWAKEVERNNPAPTAHTATAAPFRILLPLAFLSIGFGSRLGTAMTIMDPRFLLWKISGTGSLDAQTPNLSILWYRTFISHTEKKKLNLIARIM